ncbi:MAG: MoxR family ATPase [Candidatus Micrarchaeota archaeon]|nr:MoxR family ATPase [Candidatus Micrarchaeota archaeon]MDE1824515.1 MoxR family ATPase [Candidatus Micrarchaeota archaeon]MDE1849273.1 MoxR family ATPase [Candidatus Micrarchaeota archaeon]
MDARDAYQKVKAEMKKHIAGKDETIELLFITLVANGHALLEGVPGVAKTTMSKALADCIQADFKRIQGSPDLVPSDILGESYLDKDNETQFKKGPIFTNILLVDELNRSPPKTMAAFLETLEERMVTIGGVNIPLPRPFTALATQNPLRIEGTEQLPKVLADRFIMKIDVDYPSMEEEVSMLRIKEAEEKIITSKVISIEDILDFQEKVKAVKMPDDVARFIASIVSESRKEIHVVMGASPRADIAFMQCSKARALISGRTETTKDDIRFLAKPILSHRMTVRSTGGIGIHGIIDGIIASVT